MTNPINQIFVPWMAVLLLFTFIKNLPPSTAPVQFCPAPAAQGVESIAVRRDRRKIVRYGWEEVPGISQYRLQVERNKLLVLDTLTENTNARFPVPDLHTGDQLAFTVSSVCGSSFSRPRTDSLRFMNTLVDDDIVFLRVTDDQPLRTLCQYKADYLHFAQGRLRLDHRLLLDLGPYRSQHLYDFNAFKQQFCDQSDSSRKSYSDLRQMLGQIDQLPKVYYYHPGRLSHSRRN